MSIANYKAYLRQKVLKIIIRSEIHDESVIECLP